eukprot:COSAG02_NODE_2504_length_8663_cov_3.628211_3_plen_154_part_00
MRRNHTSACISYSGASAPPSGVAQSFRERGPCGLLLPAPSQLRQPLTSNSKRQTAKACTPMAGAEGGSGNGHKALCPLPRRGRCRGGCCGTRRRCARALRTTCGGSASRPYERRRTCIARAGQLYVSSADDADPRFLIHGTHRTVDVYVYMIY